MPKTILGRWSAGLLLAFFACFAIQMLFMATGQRGGETLFDNWYLAVTGLGAALSAVAAFVVGVIALIKGERSAFVYLSLVIGAFVVVFLFGEAFLPH